MKEATVSEFLRTHPQYRKRQYIPLLVELLTGVSRKQQIEAKTTLRRLQELIPNDEKGKQMEKAWRFEKGQASMSELIEMSFNQ